jgi:phospholipid/cholesterol/gamma-HCH transport system permease protein
MKPPQTSSPVNQFLPPIIDLSEIESLPCVTVRGNWTLRGLAIGDPDLRTSLKVLGSGKKEPNWDLMSIEALDTAGAYVLWEAWGMRLPERIKLRKEHESAILRWQNRSLPSMTERQAPIPLLHMFRKLIEQLGEHLIDMVALLGQVILDLIYLVRHPKNIPWREISATTHETGGRALGITALVGFLIGIVVSYLSSLQLKTFGAEIYIINILGLSIIRELGPLLAAIIVAGRSGSAMTARIGVMRVTQELDALSSMGISPSIRLIIPKVIALVLCLPLLVVWTDIIAIIGGAMSAHLELNLGYQQFFLKLPSVVPLTNLIIGLSKGVVFGLLIALIACHFGLRIEPNTESLGNETTNSVVVAITLVILVDAVFAVLFRGIGI